MSIVTALAFVGGLILAQAALAAIVGGIIAVRSRITRRKCSH